MRLFDLLKTKEETAGIMAFGFFDSIHLGHQAVIRKAVDLAKNNHMIASVFLFKNNIFPLLGIEKYPIYSFEERIDLICSLGVDVVYYVNADHEYLSMSPSEFLADLKQKVCLSGFACGSDFTFGTNGKGKVSDLKKEIGGTYAVLDLVELEGEKISSERVKTSLSYGNLSDVRRCLGRDFSIKRKVRPGRRDGAKIGFPTVNTDLLFVPLRTGVYFTNVIVGGKIYQAVTNVGTHPTFADLSANIESHLLSFDRDLYGEEIEITFLKYHREIERYDTPEALGERIAKDVYERRKYD